jgi:beta-lactamase regulating signal transducer with metallopeptidase domain
MTSSELLTGPIAQAIGWALLHLLWQGAIVAGILAAVLGLLPRRAANLRYLASCTALALLPLLAIATAIRAYEQPAVVAAAPLSIMAAATAPAETATTTLASPAQAPTTAQRLRSAAVAARGVLPYIVLAWLVGVVLLSIRLVVSWLRVRRLTTRNVGPAGSEWEATALRLAHALWLPRAVRILRSAAVEVPTVIGWLRPVVLLPASTLAGLSGEQIEMILAHELAHIRRHDFFVNLMQALVETLMFYHPAVWWISASVRQERENCCDDLAVAVCGNPLQYARALTRLEELRVKPVHMAVAASGGSLLARIRRLVKAQDVTGSGSRWLAGAAVIGLVGVLLALPTLPILAQRERSAGTTTETPKPRPSSTEIEVRAPQATPEPSGQEEAVEEGNAVSDDAIDDGVDGGIEAVLADLAEIPEVPAPPAAPPAPPTPMVAGMPAVPMAPLAPAAPYPAPMVHAYPAMAPLARIEGIALAEALPAAELAALDAARTPTPDIVLRARRHRQFGESGKLSVDDLVALRASGITPEYIKEMRESGLGQLSLNDVYALRTQGITASWIRDMRAAGVPLGSASDALMLRVQGVSASYIKALQDAGYRNLTSRELGALASQGVSSNYVKALADAGYKGLSARDLTALASQGVSPQFIQSLADAGYKNLSVHDLVILASQGVSPKFIQSLSDAGYHGLSARELSRLAASGVTPEFIREMSQYKDKSKDK